MKSLLRILVLFLVISGIQTPSYAGSLESITINKQNFSPGEKVIWSIKFNCGDQLVNQIWINLLDPFGDNQFLSVYLGEGKGPTPFAPMKSGTFELPLFISEDAPSGNYLVIDAVVNCVNSNETTKFLNGQSISFSVTNNLKLVKNETIQINKIEMMTPSERNVGDPVVFAADLSSNTPITNFCLGIISPNGTQLADCETFTTNSSQVTKGIYRSEIAFRVDESWVPGSYRIYQYSANGTFGTDTVRPLNLEAAYGLNTSSWSKVISYYNGVVSSVRPTKANYSVPEVSSIKFLVKNDGQQIPYAPIVTSGVLITPSVAAGDKAIFEFDVDARGGYLYDLQGYLGNVYTNENVNAKAWFSNPVDKSVDLSKPLQKAKLTLELLIPRNTPIGNYLLRQLSIISTACDSARFKSFNLSNNPGNCLSNTKVRNMTYSYQGNYSIYAIPATDAPTYNVLKYLPVLKVTAANDPIAPEMTISSIEQNRILVKASLDNDYDCTYTASVGDVSTSKRYLQSNFNYVSIMVSSIPTYSKIILQQKCKTIDGKDIFSEVSTVTLMPSPPTAPIPTILELDHQSMKIRLEKLNAEWKYNYLFDAGIGELIDSKELSVTLLNPETKVTIKVEIEDKYGQSGTFLLGTFTTRPAPNPVMPTLKQVKQGKSQAIVAFKAESEVNYVVKVSTCKSRLSGNFIELSSCIKGKIPVVKLLATNKWGKTTESAPLKIKLG